MKRYKGLICILFTILFFLPGMSVSGEPDPTTTNDDAVVDEDLIDHIQLDGIQQYWDTLTNEYGGYLPELEKTSLVEFLKDNGPFSLKNTITGLLKFLLYELVLNGKLLGSLLLLTLFSVILQTMHTAFENSAISKIAYFVVYVVLLYIALNSFFLAFTYTKEAIDTMSSFMIALIPLILGLMATFGHVMTISFFHPIIIMLINLSGVLVSTIILPLLFLAALLLIVSSLSENYQVTHLASLFRTISLGILGAFLTVFIGVMSVQGTASAIQDGVVMKTAKFITGNFIPVIGRTFTDAADTVLSASLLLKNAVGILGVLIIIFIAAFPAIKLFVIALIYKIAAAVLQPIGDGPVISSLNTISKYMVYILACLLAVTLMFFLAIVIIVIASHVTLLLR
ncbi:MAG TPA: stage III sporulation protein AE [Virgibacillus sp.]|nr:stage III sporulation protein AE [Virgibacillus sp.]